MNASFVLSSCPIVAKTTIAIGGADRIADIASFWDLTALSREQKLLPHFGEAGIAVFAIEEIEYGGHDLTPSFDHVHGCWPLIVSGRLRRSRKWLLQRGKLFHCKENEETNSRAREGCRVMLVSSLHHHCPFQLVGASWRRAGGDLRPKHDRKPILLPDFSKFR